MGLWGGVCRTGEGVCGTGEEVCGEGVWGGGCVWDCGVGVGDWGGVCRTVGRGV